MKKFLTTLLASVVTLAPTGVMAGNNNIDEHQQLWDTLRLLDRDWETLEVTNFNSPRDYHH